MKRIVMAFILVCSLMTAPADAQNIPLGFIGEKISYNIKKGILKVGEAVLEFKGEATVNGQPVYLIVFTATSFNFFDQEKIYVDQKTFLPVMVKRKLNIFGKKNKIIEYYDQPAGTIRIVTNSGEQEQIQVIRKKGPIENIYGFIYRYRRNGRFEIGEEIKLSLPTTDVMSVLEKVDKISAGGEQREAYFLTSGDYRIWFGTGDKNIPLRIDGATGMMSAALIMREYQSGKSDDGTAR